MKVTRWQILARGLSNRCPNCGGRTLFRKGTLFRSNPACPACGLRLEHDEGFFIGSLSLNYGVTVVGILLPLLLLAYWGVLGVAAASAAAVVAAVVAPILFYRPARSWWLMNYYLVVPQQLPANRAAEPPGGDDNH